MYSKLLYISTITLPGASLATICKIFVLEEVLFMLPDIPKIVSFDYRS